MLSLSNGLSFLRAPLALLFLVDSVTWRITAIILAMISDSIDGYLARRYRSTSQFGAILDPTMDKFFVFFGLGVMLMEGRMEIWQAGAMLSRDFFLCLFGIYLSLSGKWNSYRFRAIRWGKVATALQFLILIGLTLHLSFPWFIYALFILFGSLAFFELLQVKSDDQPSPT
ncbi:MAG: CDP-alcohol phosphatidyltransferase family protein [Chlamydiales bacterium]|nr:CDP-alcohol phosphatidyltransferase family protein [Chlamydiales bacterium]